jgi:hypothetical protein
MNLNDSGCAPALQQHILKMTMGAPERTLLTGFLARIR